MKITVLTSNSIRHKFVANEMEKVASDCLVVSEIKKSNSEIDENLEFSIREHFKKRFQTEDLFFENNNFFNAKTVPILYKEVNTPYVFEVIKKFQPDLIIVFGSSIIKEPLISLMPKDRFINLHLGISPYYKGSGTNFWPFVNNELEFVGATILHLDPGIDTGDIITHVRPTFEKEDNVHTAGCKVIKESTLVIQKIISMIQNNEKIPRIKQWKIDNERIYRNADFNEDVLLRYKDNLANGMVEKFIQNEQKKIKLINL